MTRRDALRVLGLGAGTCAAAAVAPGLTGGAVAATVLSRRPAPLPTALEGEVLTAQSWNALVQRVNQLTAQAQP